MTGCLAGTDGGICLEEALERGGNGGGEELTLIRWAYGGTYVGSVLYALWARPCHGIIP